MLYLDYVATTPLSKEVLETYHQLLKDKFANSDSIHGLGIEIENLMEKSRALIAKMLVCKPQELIFTSGASEANNLAIKGICDKYKNRGKHIITTHLEHSSIYGPIDYLKENGYKVDYVKTYSNGLVDLTDLETYYFYRDKFDKSLVSRLTHKQRLLLHPLLLKIISYRNKKAAQYGSGIDKILRKKIFKNQNINKYFNNLKENI